MAQTARNVLIIVALAAAVTFIPGGGDVANALAALLSLGILVAFVLIAARYYRENRMEIFGLGDQWRAVFYGAVGVIVFAMAARPRLFDLGGGGTLLWMVLLAGAVYALYRVWRQHREYSF